MQALMSKFTVFQDIENNTVLFKLWNSLLSKLKSTFKHMFIGKIFVKPCDKQRVTNNTDFMAKTKITKYGDTML